MEGPELIVKTLSNFDNVTDKFKNTWQYHSRSDHHSKTCCFAILFDLLRQCSELRRHASEGTIGFGINHTFHDFAQNKKKDLDLVICKPADAKESGPTLPDFAARYRLRMTREQLDFISGFPAFQSVTVGSALIAIEAKAAMTAHVRACPRLHDELNSSHNIVHGHDETSIAAGIALVNLSDTFVSSDLNKWSLVDHPPSVSKHRQPKDAEKVIETIRGLKRRSDTSGSGFDAVAVMVVKCRNDGSAVELISDTPAPGRNDIFEYASLINRVCARYRSRFPLQ